MKCIEYIWINEFANSLYNKSTSYIFNFELYYILSITKTLFCLQNVKSLQLSSKLKMRLNGVRFHNIAIIGLRNVWVNVKWIWVIICITDLMFFLTKYLNYEPLNMLSRCSRSMQLANSFRVESSNVKPFLAWIGFFPMSTLSFSDRLVWSWWHAIWRETMFRSPIALRTVLSGITTELWEIPVLWMAD